MFFHGLAWCFLILAKLIETINTYLKLWRFFFFSSVLSDSSIIDAV